MYKRTMTSSELIEEYEKDYEWCKNVDQHLNFKRMQAVAKRNKIKSHLVEHDRLSPCGNAVYSVIDLRGTSGRFIPSFIFSVLKDFKDGDYCMSSQKHIGHDTGTCWVMWREYTTHLFERYKERFLMVAEPDKYRNIDPTELRKLFFKRNFTEASTRLLPARPEKQEYANIELFCPINDGVIFGFNDKSDKRLEVMCTFLSYADIFNSKYKMNAVRDLLAEDKEFTAQLPRKVWLSLFADRHAVY